MTPLMHSRRRDPAWPSQFFSFCVMFEVVEISRACFIQLHADACCVVSLVSLQLSVMTLCFAIHGDCLILNFNFFRTQCTLSGLCDKQ